ARNAIRAANERLMGDRFDAGLVLYGHRVANSRDKKGEWVIQRRYAKRFPFAPGLEPFRDVEVAIPTGRFDSQTSALFQARLNAVVPWGQTPLHLAIRTAIEDLSSNSGSDAARPRDVIAITDGRNYQFNPTADAVVSMQQVVAAARQNNVRLHLVGFELAATQAARAKAEFEFLTQQTGGRYVESIDDLLGNLIVPDTDTHPAARITTDTLNVANSTSVANSINVASAADGIKSAQGIEAKVGQTVDVNLVQSENQSIQIAIGKSTYPATLSPGDHLRLIWNARDQKLRANPYSHRAPTFRDLFASDGTPLPARLGFHRPRCDAESATFEFSYRATTSLVAPRPKYVWAEIKSRSASSPAGSEHPIGISYRTSAVRWLGGQSNPVARLQCSVWPEKATQYQARLWSTDRDPAFRRIRVPMGAPRGDSAGSQIADRAAQPQCQASWQDHVLNIRVLYDDCGEDGGAMWIVRPGQDETTWEMLGESYDVIRKQSEHRFQFHHDLAINKDAAVKLDVVSIASFKDVASTTRMPFEGKILTQSPTAVATGRPILSTATTSFQR
ncbi:MAG: vWA domain-containing protein, partial [Planctomycetota bacterium]